MNDASNEKKKTSEPESGGCEILVVHETEHRGAVQPRCTRENSVVESGKKQRLESRKHSSFV